MQTLQVQCPMDAMQGSVIQVSTPSGELMQVEVPTGVGPGAMFHVLVPAQPAIQQTMQQPLAPGMEQPMMQQPLMAGHPAAMGAPQQMVMQHVDPFQLLAGLPSVKIEQKMNMLETATGLIGEMIGVNLEIEMANKYVVQTTQGHPLFFAVEQTDFLNRQCMGDCRAIDIDVVVLGQDPKLQADAAGQFDWSFNPFGKVDLAGSQLFVHLHKDCQPTCCCFNRPVIQVTHGRSGQLIGTITDPFACCDMTFSVRDPSDNVVMSATGGCCQLGMICPCPMGPCSEVHFTVNDSKSGDRIGALTKQIPDFMKYIVADDVSNYEVDFGAVAHPEWKAMLVALGLFIDARYFNTRSDKNENAFEAMNPLAGFAS